MRTNTAFLWQNIDFLFENVIIVLSVQFSAPEFRDGGRGIMKKCIKLLGKSALLIALCAAVGLALLVAAFALPTAPMADNLAASVDTFSRERTYPSVRALGSTARLDNFTDALMLQQAAYCADAPLLQRTLNVYRPFAHGQNPALMLVLLHTDAQTQPEQSSYARYWHGYLVTLKPLLSILAYEQIRTLNAVWLAALVLGLCALMYVRKLGRYILPLLLTLLMLSPVAISMSLQFTSVFSVSMLGAIALLIWRERLLTSIERLALFFVLIGCMTSYLDLLSYPLVAYGIPATLAVCASEGDAKQGLRLLAATLVGWGIGYVGMWAAKWALCALLSGEEAGVLETIRLRVSMSDGGGQRTSLIRVLMRQAFFFISPAMFAGVAFALVCAAFFMARRRRDGLRLHMWQAHIGLCMLPFLWYAGTGNHAYIHCWFTYRTLAVCAFSGMCLFIVRRRPGRATPAPAAAPAHRGCRV